VSEIRTYTLVELDAFERHAYQLADRIRRARARQFAPNTP
jgi:hypothetical protein